MKTGAGIAIGLSVALAAGGGYWLGQRPACTVVRQGRWVQGALGGASGISPQWIPTD